MDEKHERGYASYRGLMSDGAPFPCPYCHREGREETMVYQGIEQIPRDPNLTWQDTIDCMPYDVWKCRFGHRYQDGY